MSKYRYDGDLRLIQPDPEHSREVKLYHRLCTPAGGHVIVKHGHELDGVFMGPGEKPATMICPGCKKEIEVKTIADD